MNSVSNFKSDLEQLNNNELILKYIYSSEIWYFKQRSPSNKKRHSESLDILHQVISESFQTSFKNIQVVGSGKTGFSLSPKKPFQEFDGDKDKPSDLDVAIISSELFHKYWNLMRAHTTIKVQAYLSSFSNSIYKGFIPPKAFKDIKEIRQEFNKSKDHANKILQRSLSLEHELKFRIYRSWNDLEDYHNSGIAEIRKTNMQ